MKIFTITTIIFIFSNLAFAADFYKFKFLVCDSLKDINYSFGVENNNNSLIIHKLDGKKFKNKKLQLNKKNYIFYLNKSYYFDKEIFMDVSRRQFYLAKNSKYLGGCFATKSINTMLCKLKNYNNISKGKLPIISCS